MDQLPSLEKYITFEANQNKEANWMILKTFTKWRKMLSIKTQYIIYENDKLFNLEHEPDSNKLTIRQSRITFNNRR